MRKMSEDVKDYIAKVIKPMSAEDKADFAEYLKASNELYEYEVELENRNADFHEFPDWGEFHDKHPLKESLQEPMGLLADISVTWRIPTEDIIDINEQVIKALEA